MRLSETVEVIPVDADRARRAVHQLTSLDASLRAELGDMYSHLDWTAESFLTPRPEKWALSHAAFEGTELKGFWIGSRIGEDAHAHRVAVDRSARRAGVGRALFEAVAIAARRLCCRRITLTIASKNEQARAFYDQLGFLRLRGADLAGFADARARRLISERDEIVEEHGGRSFPYVAYAYAVKP